MNTYKIVANPNSRHGFDLITMREDGSMDRQELTSKTTDNYFKLNLPQEYNIKYLAIKQIKANLNEEGEYTIEPRTQRLASTSNTSNSSGLSWMNYISEEEKTTIEAIKAKAMKAMQIDKIKAQIAMLEKQLEDAE